MAEYIARKALYKALTTAAVNDKFKSIGTWAKAICVLHDLPAADVAPVVRCEDCLYWVSGKNECESWEWCKMLNTDMPPNGFCYLGDRKDDDDAKEN